MGTFYDALGQIWAPEYKEKESLFITHVRRYIQI